MAQNSPVPTQTASEAKPRPPRPRHPGGERSEARADLGAGDRRSGKAEQGEEHSRTLSTASTGVRREAKPERRDPSLALGLDG